MLLFLEGGSPALDQFPIGGAPAGFHGGQSIMAAGSFNSRDAGGKGVSVKGSTKSNYKQIDHLHGMYKPNNTRNNTNNVLPTGRGGKYRGR